MVNSNLCLRKRYDFVVNLKVAHILNKFVAGGWLLRSQLTDLFFRFFPLTIFKFVFNDYSVATDVLLYNLQVLLQ